LLAKYPENQIKLREEMREYMPFLFDDSTRFNKDVLYKADVDLLPFLDDFCRESLRYIPSIPMTVRQSIKEDTLGGFVVPAGTTIYILANAINRLSMYWGPTANDFDPTRWKNLPDTWTANAYMTFLQGPRGCIGRKFAETEMKTLLCCLLSKYTFESDASQQDPEELKMWRLVLRPRDGVSLKTTPIA
jgi:cytochrome P450